MKVLITGAAGYLGAELARAFRDEHALTLLDICRPDGADDGGDERWVVGDVTDLERLRPIVAGHDAVVHTVALVRDRFSAPLQRYVDVMVKGTWNIAQACATEGVARLVNISSIAVYGGARSHDQVITATDAYSKEDLFYGLSKRLGEEIVNAYGVVYPELATVNIRPGVIAGDGANSGPVRSPDARRYWFRYVDVRDVAAAVRGSLAKDPAPRGSYAVVAARDDALYDWRSGAEQLGYVPEHTWPSV
ncbi:nucleoside-diphosphate-sugar epimerase [Bradyrhizobium sp. USDA 4503]